MKRVEKSLVGKTRPRRLPRTVSTSADRGSGGGVAGRLVLLLLANLSALTALLVYFGWRRSKTQSQALGIDESVLGMTTQEYVLRSVGPVFGLLTILGAVGLAWLWIDYWINRLVTDRAPASRWVYWSLLVVSPLPLLVVYVAGFRWDAQAYVAFPLGLVACPLLLFYRVQIQREHSRINVRHHDVLRGLVVLAAAACLFWSASNYAEVLGDSLARDFASTLPGQAGVVIYSSDPLHLDAAGVRTETVGDDKTPWRYRYSGLHMMDHRGGKYFLVSDSWTLRQGTVIILRDDDKIRVEFQRG